ALVTLIALIASGMRAAALLVLHMAPPTRLTPSRLVACMAEVSASPPAVYISRPRALARRPAPSASRRPGRAPPAA
ncbi:MAG TPA: hypothetical protein VFX49_20975, partial [Chloroflexota bacterium]|nr:hypothetical protein [Chloroflexota bacterium]